MQILSAANEKDAYKKLSLSKGTYAEKSGTNEFSEINERIMNLLSNKFLMESKLAENVVRLQKSRLIALQSQFNPHFMFNTLQSVNRYCTCKVQGGNGNFKRYLFVFGYTQNGISTAILQML